MTNTMKRIEEMQKIVTPSPAVRYQSDIFTDQREFMEACGQTVGEYDDDQASLYYDLIHEEFAEFNRACVEFSGQDSGVEEVVEVVDALIDMIVVCAGMLWSLGVSPRDCWDAVHKSNMAKVDKETGKVRRREDGKILKPYDWVPPTKDLQDICWDWIK